jgi:hypothetical protein
LGAKTKGQMLLEKLQEREYKRLGRLAEYESRRALRDTSFNNKILEEMLQKQGFFFSPEEIAEIRSQLTSHINEVANAELPTKYEDPAKYAIMTHLAKEIEEAATQLGRPLPIKPQIGTLPTGQVNAMAVQVPASNEYLVIFESDLFTFALLLSKVIARAMPFKGSDQGMLQFSTAEEDMGKNITDNPEIVRRFQEVVLAYLIKGKPSAAPPYIPEEPYGTLAAILRDSMELFIMAHEYGHIIKGHLSSAEAAPIDLGGQKGDEVIRNWRQEIEADAQGLELMIYAMGKRGLDLALSYWGADFFFSCIEIVEHGISIVRTGEEGEGGAGSDSHPPVGLRREMLREVLKNSIPEDRATGPIQLGAVLEQIVASLWEHTKPLLRRYHESGQKLSPIWG